MIRKSIKYSFLVGSILSFLFVTCASLEMFALLQLGIPTWFILCWVVVMVITITYGAFGFIFTGEVY
jgi:hypothetical protein